MAFVICMVPAAPLRNESAHRSEMVSQLLFGEIAELLEEGKLFVKLRCLYDDYEGWCQLSQLAVIDESLVKQNTNVLSDEWTSIIDVNGQQMHISMGSSLGLLQNGKMNIGKQVVSYNGKTADPSVSKITGESVKEKAFQYLNTAYLWGGRSVFGIDCSGFVQQVFRATTFQFRHSRLFWL